ncbi:hypothetical protein SAMN04487947_4074 [Halogeometricum rufum]|uniref:Uncharacterized protein n=1 Tax=Halogeometricum rufum TaxID=553469 RepID=A0A1I6J5Q4_9EURY|nr:hypothetical protein [Halogeometricum rufum]SFR74247.1 hypothetical protein SAMN04487947_4074 [Halogeometricum rufum]
MTGHDRGRTPQKGDEYSHRDGTTEVVFTTQDDRVLTFREYPDADSFDRTVSSATYRGVNEDVASLPEASAFADADETGDE